MKEFTLIRGNAMQPEADDLIMVRDLLPVGKPVPEGFKVLSGNNHNSEIVGLFMRYELKE